MSPTPLSAGRRPCVVDFCVCTIRVVVCRLRLSRICVSLCLWCCVVAELTSRSAVSSVLILPVVALSAARAFSLIDLSVLVCCGRLCVSCVRFRVLIVHVLYF